MSQLFDLSHPLEDQMPVYPGDEPCRLVQQKTAECDGFISFLLNTGLHAGTHLDAPLHFLAKGAMVRDLPIHNFIGRGKLLDVRSENVLGLRPEYASLIGEGDIVLLWSDHSEKFETEGYYVEHPIVREDLADFLVQKKIRMLGMDFPSPDRMPFPIHKKILGAGIPLLENLTNLASLQDLSEFEIMAFPLKVGAEGSPVRVVARGK